MFVCKTNELYVSLRLLRWHTKKIVTKQKKISRDINKTWNPICHTLPCTTHWLHACKREDNVTINQRVCERRERRDLCSLPNKCLSVSSQCAARVISFFYAANVLQVRLLLPPVENISKHPLFVINMKNGFVRVFAIIPLYLKHIMLLI